MKDHGHPLRRMGRHHESRVHRANLASLDDEWSYTGGAVSRSNTRVKSAMHTLSERNWRVKREGSEVVAIEPGRDYETPFHGPDAFWEAVEFAAAKLKGAK